MVANADSTEHPGGGRTARHRCRLSGRIFLAVCAIAVAALAVGWLERNWVLRSAAWLWIVSDVVRPADAVAVFGGGIAERPFAAAEYYRNGLAKKVLVSSVPESRPNALGVVLSDTAANRQVLIKLGVPEDAIETFGKGLRNTYQEALALRAWVDRTGARSVIVPTEIFSARRVSWTLHRALPEGLPLYVPALVPEEYDGDNWWQHERGLIAFQNEVVKFIYYRLRY
jgi:uncharacterized SAM-binding protein YcdF (DUF218 family)